MSDRGIKLEDDHRDTHDEGGDDEVRAGSFCDSPALDSPTCVVRGAVLKSLETRHLEKVIADDMPLGRDICNEKKSSGDGG